MATNNTAYFNKVITMVLLVVAFFLVSCEQKIVLKEPFIEKPLEEKAVTDHFAIAEKHWRHKEYDKALAAYDRYLAEYPRGDRVRDVLARKATIYYGRNQYEEALPLLLEVIDKYPVNEQRAEINLLLAKTYFHLEKYPESRLSALQWLELYEDYPGKEEIFFLLGQNAKQLKDYPRVCYWWFKVLESPQSTKEKKEEIRSQLLDLIYEATEEELKEMAVYARQSSLLFPIYYRLATSYLLTDRLEEAQELAIKIMRFAGEGEWFTVAKELMEKIQRVVQVEPNAIGCLLPLSGPFAIYGQEVLHGLELGLDIFRETDENLSSLELVIRDTEGESERACEAIRELAEKQRVVVIIGPLLSRVAEEVVTIGQELGIPIITLSQSEGITSAGEMVFQNCLTPEDQVRSLTDKVLGEIGLKRFAILHPDNAYGRYFMNKFWDEVEFHGGTVTAVETYDSKDTDFATPIKKMVGLFYTRPKPESEEEKGSGEKPDPIIDFDAVFIPDSYERAGLIASQLAFYDVVEVTLLGTNLWNSPKLIEIAGRYVNGAIFPSGFFPGSGFRGVDSFVEQYQLNFQQKPGLLAAIGYDSIGIIKEIVREQGGDIRTREDLRSALAGIEGFEGVTGPMAFDSERRSQRDPLLLTISGKHFLPLP
ncbi:MAG: penicillin-binding protein activator [Deltaproteobacteria bacterium]|nr:penicillin-binding protein activator [Deltaproteobacteria bacterium]MBW2339285.1 penicillin-binding protein activator [Deltaproteobacteria bacterium]